MWKDYLTVDVWCGLSVLNFVTRIVAVVHGAGTVALLLCRFVWETSLIYAQHPRAINEDYGYLFVNFFLCYVKLLDK